MEMPVEQKKSHFREVTKHPIINKKKDKGVDIQISRNQSMDEEYEKF